jgi:hypothetical protein
MSDFVPAVMEIVGGAVVAAGASILLWWRGSAQTEQKLKDQTEHNEEKFKDLRSRLKEHIDLNDRNEAQITRDLRDAVTNLQNAVIDIRVMAREQAVINQVAAKAMEGLVNRQEAHSMMIREIQTKQESFSEQLKHVLNSGD